MTEAFRYLSYLKLNSSVVITSYLAGDYFQARRNIIPVRKQSSLIITKSAYARPGDRLNGFENGKTELVKWADLQK